MDEMRMEAPKLSSETPVLFFPPHRRRPLKSQTYNTLLLIFSQFTDESFASQNLETNLSTDNGSNELQQRIEEQESQPLELVDSAEPKSLEFEKVTELNSSGGDDKSSKDIMISEQMSIDQIKQLMGLEEEIEDSSIPEESYPEQMIIDELVHIVQGNEDISPETNPKPLIGKSGAFQQIDISGNASQMIPCADNITTNESEIQETVEPISVAEIKPLLVSEDEYRRLPETNASMDVDTEKPTEVVEEGEISGGYAEDVVSMDLLLQDNEIRDKKADEEVITGSKSDGNELVRESESSFFCADTAETTKNSGTVQESDVNGAINVPDFVDPTLEARRLNKEVNDRSNSLVVYDNIWDDIIPAEQQDVADCPKRKRGPITKEKRAKRKAKDRKKRAEKNRQLGVRRVKLPPIPISKPKPIQYCRHFLHGRCQEGDKCKFSHDTVPLTKSKACCHFARHSCMKGDDCPFDHQLSKYPCTNFASNGFCGRGDDCLFSHKTLSEEDSSAASKATEVEKKLASLIADATSKKQQNNAAGNADKSLNGSASKQPQSVAAKVTSSLSVGNQLPVEKPKQRQILSRNGNFNTESGTHFDQLRSSKVLPSPPAVTPKGVNFISIGRGQHDDTKSGTHFDQLRSATVLPSPPSATPKGVNFILIGRGQRDDTKSGTHFDQLRSTTVLTSPPSATPKGVNFISIGRGQNDGLSGSVNGVNQSALESSRNPSQSSSAPASDPTPKGINFLSFGNASTKTPTSQTTPTTLSDSAPKGINFFTFGRTPIHKSSDTGKAKLTSDRKDGQSAVSPALIPSFPISLIQSSLGSATHKDTPHSAQKALFSMLAFAAKYESRKEDSKGTGSIGGSQDNLSKVSKLSEFLSSYSGKTEQ